MPYLDCCILETQRIHNTSPSVFQRIVVEDTLIDGIPVYKDTLLENILLAATHNEKEFPEPFKFKPERWENDKKRSEHENMVSYIFGAGLRACIGKNLAQLEKRIIIIKFLKRYSNLVEHALLKGKREYHLQIAYTIKDSTVTLTKAE